MSYDRRIPYVLMVLGTTLAGIMVGEILYTLSTPVYQFSIPVVANYVSSLPFVVTLVGGGYWLLNSDFDPAAFGRIAKWVGIGMAFFLLFAGLAAVGQQSWLARVEIMRWGASIGSGAGLLIGISEAKAIERSVQAERARLRARELEWKNERLEEFANIIAHDLRNPLNVASGRLDLATEKYDDEHLDEVDAALGRMNQIIEKTLRLARSGKVIDEPNAVDLADIATRCWSTVPTAQASMAIDRSATIRADPDRLQHLFENLFRNAVEHGGSDVTVHVGTHPDGFYVEDDGPGIPAANYDSVIEAGVSKSEDGTGFGLAIVNQIAEAHGWEFTLSKGDSGGVRFDFTGVTFETRPAESTPESALGSAPGSGGILSQ